MAATARAGSTSTNPLRRAWPLFALVTLASLGILSLWPLQAVRDYRTLRLYQPTQCTVIDRRALHSTMTTRLQGNITRRDVYTPEVMFSYQVAGRPFTAAGYDNYDGRTSDASVLVSFPVNAVVPCWYDPDHPERAVVARTFSRGYYAGGLIPLVLALVSGSFLSASLRRRPQMAALTTLAGSVLAVRLAPEFTHRQQTTTQFAIGTVLGVALVLYSAWMVRVHGILGPLDNGLWFFFLLFVAADVAVFRMAWRGMHAWTVPDPEVEIDREPLAPGDTVSIAVRVPGPLAFRDLVVALVCEIEGEKDEKPRRHQVFRESSGEIAAGDWFTRTSSMTIPADAALSAHWANTLVTWKIGVRLKTASGVAVKQQYPFRVVAGEGPGAQVS